MLSGKTDRCLVLLCSLLTVAAAKAVPTTVNCSTSPAASTVLPSPDVRDGSTSAMAIGQIGEAPIAHLARIRAEFLKPPSDSAYSAPSMVHAQHLPPIPGALFMALTGLLCIVIVKDHRIWMAALTGLFCAGQAGFGALPQLASHLRARKQVEQQGALNITYGRGPGDSLRLRSDIEGTQYIGLLHHLAGIPANTMSLPSPVPLALSQEQTAFSPERSRTTKVVRALSDGQTPAQSKDTFRVPQYAVASLLSRLIHTNDCSAHTTEQPISFSPAFIFQSLARGPPNPD